MLATCTLSFSQNCDPRSGPPVQMQVQLAYGENESAETVPGDISSQKDSMHRDAAVGGEQGHAFKNNMQVRVELQDALGGTLQQGSPNAEGKLQFTTCSDGAYRLRVTGPNIEESLVEDLQPGRGDRMVNVTLHHKPETSKPNAPRATASTLALHIPRKAHKQLERGDAALRQGKLGNAEERYAKAVEIYPQFAQAENNLGIVLMKEGRRPEGKTAFERALAIDARYAPAQVNLAKIAFDDKRFQDALKLARQALTTEPLSTAALFVATEASFFSGNYSDTISYSRTLHLLPHKEFSLIHFLAARSLEAEHRSDEATSEYQTFLREDPHDPNAARARESLTLLQAARGSKSPALR
jgi:Tfp pilus assembly protein PilF